MKKNHPTPEHITQRKIFKRRRILKQRKKNGRLRSNTLIKPILIREIIVAPKDFRFINNPEKCLFFFNKIRSKENHSVINGRLLYRISLSKVENIDFATLSILKSIFEESKFYGILFKGNYPKNIECKKFLIDSGFLNNLYGDDQKEIHIRGNGAYFSFEKKQGILTVKDFENFEKISEDAYEHITKEKGFSDEIITLLKEIGGNAIEWSDSYNNQWQIGVFKQNDKVIFNVTDLGKGILDSLYVSEKLKLLDFFLIRDDLDVLQRAFERKYGSVSQEINRNRGLPSIKRIHDINKIANLVVCSNNVFHNFGDVNNSILFKLDNFNFFGTFYQWELNQTCI
jgi:hypothetical protein